MLLQQESVWKQRENNNDLVCESSSFTPVKMLL